MEYEYKAGDRVRMVSDHLNSYGVPTGTYGTIDWVGKIAFTVLFDNGNEAVCTNDNVELLKRD